MDIDILDNDPSGPNLTVTEVTDPPHGTVVLHPDGTVTYTPDPGFSGIDTFTYTATDPEGQTVTQTVRVTVTPAGTDDVIGEPVKGPTVIDVLENDPTGPSATITSVTQPEHGTVVINEDGTVTYTPDPGYTGTDSFTYTACDADGQCYTQTVTVPVDSPPLPEPPTPTTPTVPGDPGDPGDPGNPPYQGAPGSGLPRTGSNTAPLVSFGLLLLAVGALALGTRRMVGLRR